MAVTAGSVDEVARVHADGGVADSASLRSHLASLSSAGDTDELLRLARAYDAAIVSALTGSAPQPRPPPSPSPSSSPTPPPIPQPPQLPPAPQPQPLPPPAAPVPAPALVMAPPAAPEPSFDADQTLLAPAPALQVKPAVDVDETGMVDGSAVRQALQSRGLPFGSATSQQPPPASPTFGSPPPPATPTPRPATPHATVAIDLGSKAVATPFTLAPSRAPLPSALPFAEARARALTLEQFAALVVALERGANPSAWFAHYGIDAQAWAAASREHYARSLSDPTFAHALDAALAHARGRPR